MQGDGGIERLVWMPSRTQRGAETRLVKKLADRNKPDLFEKIADETMRTID
ncbi:MAG: hypothetical protein MZU84_02885 [Sphingobacterium sp.]|nr:hypothetical protein [Sphingobacterium sp.]